MSSRTTPRENLAPWLRDLHAMEVEAVQLMERQVARLDHYATMKARLQQHLEETRRQQETVEGCLKKLGESSSALKDLATGAMANIQAMMNAMAGDEVVKNGLANYAFEHFEIASYKANIACAEAAGEPEIAERLRECLKEEEAMAQWLDDNLPDVVAQYLARDTAGLKADR